MTIFFVQNTKVEEGVWLELTGVQGADGDYPKCQTRVLDHPDRVDYAAGTQAVFDMDNKEDQNILDSCYKVRQFTYLHFIYISILVKRSKISHGAGALFCSIAKYCVFS